MREKQHDIGPGEVLSGNIQIPDNAHFAGIYIEGTCGGCGGKMVAHRRKAMVWVCENERWWKPWQAHAKLLATCKTVVQKGEEHDKTIQCPERK